MLGTSAPSASSQATQASGGQTSAKTAAPKPFCQASKPGTKLVGNFVPTVSAAPVPVGPIPLTPCGGYVKRWFLETVLSGGGGTTPGVFTAGGDGPWNYFALITVTEPNNNPICNLTGFNLYLADIHGGYANGSDPSQDEAYTLGSPVGNLNMTPYVPVEIDPTGLGAMSDLSGSSGYQFYALPNPDTTIFSTLPSPLPTANLAVYTEHWTLPSKTDAAQQAQSIVPPRAGTLQMWNQILNIALAAGGGNQEYQLNRMGYKIRTLGMVTRAAGARSATPFPNPMRFEWDDIILYNLDPQTLRKRMKEKTLQQAQMANEVGAYFLYFNEGISRFVGGNGASSWLSTVVDTRIALSGQFAAASTPTVDWLINDVSYAPLGGVARTSVGPGSPGFNPNQSSAVQ